MVKRPFMPNPGRIGMPGIPHAPNVPIVGQSTPECTITISVKQNGDIGIDTSRPVPAIALISIFSGLTQKLSETIIKATVPAKPTEEPLPDIPVHGDGE